jgi:hypothetical protein
MGPMFQLYCQTMKHYLNISLSVLSLMIISCEPGDYDDNELLFNMGYQMDIPILSATKVTDEFPSSSDYYEYILEYRLPIGKSRFNKFDEGINDDIITVKIIADVIDTDEDFIDMEGPIIVTKYILDTDIGIYRVRFWGGGDIYYDF